MTEKQRFHITDTFLFYEQIILKYSQDKELSYYRTKRLKVRRRWILRSIYSTQASLMTEITLIHQTLHQHFG